MFLVAALGQFWLIATGHEAPLAIFLTIVAITHSYRIAAKTQVINSRPWFSRWYGLLAVNLLALVAIASLRAFFFEPFHLPSQSMFPSMPKGSYVVVLKYGFGNYATYGIRLYRGPVAAPLSRGDVLVFEFPRDRSINYIKRLVGLPGDHIEYKNKHLYVNGTPLLTSPVGTYQEFEISQESSYQIATECNSPQPDLDVTVAPGHFFFLGDNRDNSRDSRDWGQVPEDHIIGKVVLALKNPEALPIITPRAAGSELGS